MNKICKVFFSDCLNIYSMNGNYKKTAFVFRLVIKTTLAVVLISCATDLFAQQTTILPNNSSYSNKSGPQGALRYQRGFYLVSPTEMKSSGLTNGMTINSIGFTIGAAQGDTTHGGFKVFLQNTDTAFSRADTDWLPIPAIPTNSYSITGLFPGKYEWQVRTNCAPAFSPSNNFANDFLGTCNPPTSLSSANVTDVAAQLTWVAPATGAIKYYIEYSRLDVTNWVRDSTTLLSYSLSGLVPNKAYQWRVKTKCASDSSDFVSASFTTESADVCNEPTALQNFSIAANTAKLKWTVAGGASYYTVRYRRTGTSAWATKLAFADSVILVGLSSGTMYDWQVKTNCPLGSGAYVSSTFTTTGPVTCFVPENLSTNTITSTSAVFTWNAVNGATSYDIRYRRKENISWANAIGPMTLVHNDSLILKRTTGPYNVNFVNGGAGTPFIYTGKGVYVAWEYRRPLGVLPSSNITLSTTADTIVKAVNGQDSIRYILSFTDRGDNNATNFDPVLTATILRPETRLGSSSLNDSVEVAAVYALGKTTAPKYQSPTGISALIANKSATNKTYAVALTVKAAQSGTVRFTDNQNLSVSANSSALVQFNGWSPTLLENDSIIVSVPAQPNENVINNNSRSYYQNVNPAILGYDDGTPAISSAGFGLDSGLLLARHSMKGCGKINSAQVFLTGSAKDHPLYAVVRNTAGTIVAQSSMFTPNASQTNGYHSFYFTNPPSFLNEDFYVGLAQKGSLIGYNPVGVQWEDTLPRAGAYYRAKLDGTLLVDSPKQQRLMIKAEIIPSSPQPFISGNLVLCSGGPNTLLTAGSVDTRFANSVLGFSSQNAASGFSADQSLGSPNVYPQYAISPDSWVSATADGQREYLVLAFANPAPINFIDIYETSGPGAVDTVFVRNPGTLNYDMVYSATAAAAPPVARKNRITFPLTAYNVSEVRIALNSPAVVGFNTIDAVGIGQTTVPATFTSYLWTPGGETTQTKSVSSPGTYKLTVTNASGCSSSDSVTVVTATTTPPVITASGPTTFCFGDSVRLRSSIHGGNTWSTGATTDSITVKTNGSYTVSYVAGSGCGTLTSSPVAVTVNPLPVVTITGPLGICPGSSTTLDAGAGYSTYSWSTGASTQTISVSSPGNYSVIVTNANGCRGTASVFVSNSPLPSPTITGVFDFCPGSSTVLDAGPGFSSYHWTTGATTQTITVTTAGTFGVTVTNANGCSGSHQVTTFLFTAPSPFITGRTAFCPGTSITLTANAGYSTYSWSTGATTPSINVNTAGTYTVTVTDANGCSGTASQTVSQATPPVPVITGTLSFCGSSSTTLDAGVGYDSYLWSTGATTHSITVTTAGTFMVTVTDANGCTGSASATTTTTGSIPATPGPITGISSGVCNSTGNVYTIAAVPNTAFYVWTVPFGATITAGQGSTSITVSYSNAFSSGNIIVAASNACGQSPSLNPRILTIQGAPATPGSISGQATGLCSSTGKLYSIAAVYGANSYTWAIPAGVTITGGQGTTSIAVSYSSSFVSGNISVIATNGCGQSLSSSLTVQGAADVPGSITGQATGVCASTGKIYSIAAVTGASSYTWTVPANVTITAGQGTPSLTVSFNNKFTSGNICVRTNNSCGSSAYTCMTVSGPPPIPGSITGPTTVCAKERNVAYSIGAVPGTTTYTWAVPPQAKIASGQGTTNVLITFGSTSGNISVKATNACGSSAMETLAVTLTACANVVVPGKQPVDPEPAQDVKVYPNPSNGIINIDIENGQPGKYEVQITNAIGQTVYKKEVNWDGSVITADIGPYLAAGVYNVTVFNEQYRKTIKLILQ